MASPRCDECGTGCNIEDMYVVNMPLDERPRTEHKFCSESCLKQYFFPETQKVIAEKDAEIRELCKTLSCYQEDVKKKQAKVKEKDAVIVGLRLAQGVGVAKIKDLEEEIARLKKDCVRETAR